MLKRYTTFLAGFLLVLLLAAPSVSLAKGEAKGGDSVSIPADATPQQVKEIMASMSDEQVRQLLIDELRKEAEKAPAPKKQTGLAEFVHEARNLATQLRARFEYLFSGAATAHRELPKALQNIVDGDRHMPPGRLLLALAILTALWLGAMALFKRKTAPARKSIASTPADAPWYTRMGRLFLRALLDMFGVILIAVGVFVTYLTLFSQGSASKPVIIAWLAAMLFLSLVKVAARFLLAPHAPTLRYLPLSDEAAQCFFKWSVWIARIVATGLLVTTLIRLNGGSEAMFLLVSTIFGFVVAFTLSLLTLWNKRRVAEYIRSRNEPETLLYNFADAWHLAAITYVLGFWVFWMLALMVFGTAAMLAGLLTLLVVPAYFLMDWVTQRLVAFAVEMAESDMPEEPAEATEGGEEPEVPAIIKFQRFLSKGFRVLVFAANVFLLLRIWGINFTLGRETVRAGLNILVTLVLAYIFWVFINNLIERKLKEKQPAEQTDSGEGGGGPGGDRFSTLLQLVKKFIFAAVAVVTVLIILSSMGVDIGPLIAGASVFGIAIGFGAQTLVKDIISGIFFLMDDAFRVGDYIIVGKAKGAVEEISVRSFKLRHHLGPLYTIPFGSIKEIQNMSRDWAIMKLQYLVPFDTDIQQVKKIIKKINKEIRAIPELNEFMLDDIKSQGVKAMEEFGMRMRVKFMTKPGGQFTLRKLVLAKMRKEFEAAGIEFAKPRVSVHMPEDTELTPEEEAKVAAAASKAVEKKDSAAKSPAK